MTTNLLGSMKDPRRLPSLWRYTGLSEDLVNALVSRRSRRGPFVVCVLAVTSSIGSAVQTVVDEQRVLSPALLVTKLAATLTE